MTITHHSDVAATMLVCLPAGATGHGPDRLAQLLADRLAPVAATGRADPCPHHLPVPDLLPDPLQRLLYAPRPHREGVQTATAVPVGLLDHHTHRRAIAASATAIHAEWRHTVAGTDPAKPWRHFLDTSQEHHGDHRRERAWQAFCAQPRIAAMLAAEQDGTTWFVADEYGPALCAHQTGPGRLASYIADTVQLGDALLDPHGRLMAATDPPRPRVEHTLAERDSYHAAARQLLARLDPNTVIATIHINLLPTHLPEVGVPGTTGGRTGTAHRPRHLEKR